MNTQTMTGAQIKAWQVVVLPWMSAAIEAGGGDAALFDVTMDRQPWGNFVMGIAPHAQH